MRIEPRPELRDITAYRPGSHDADEDGLLASNESPHQPGPAIRAAINSASADLHRYPDPLADELVGELAQLHGIESNQILVGNGSDELIYLLTWAFAANGGSVLSADPPYRINELSATIAGASVFLVPLIDWTHDLEAMSTIRADIAYVVNPHNPSGTARTLVDIVAFVRSCASAIPVIDEAYIDFVDDPDVRTAIPLAAAGEAMVLRTFSKAHGLAGLRLGYLVGDPDILDILRRIRPPFSVGTLAQRAGVAALRDTAAFNTGRQTVLRNRRRLRRGLEEANFKPVHSQANFILVPQVDEEAFVRLLLERGIVVRPGRSLGVPGAVRITVPGDRGMARIEAALSELCMPTAMNSTKTP